MKTKITSLLLAAAMTAGLLAGCGSATSSSGSTAETGDTDSPLAFDTAAEYEAARAEIVKGGYHGN